MEYIIAELHFVFRVMTAVAAAMILFRLFCPVIRRKNKNSERLLLTYRIYLFMGCGSFLVTIVMPVVYVGLMLSEYMADTVDKQIITTQYLIASYGSLEIPFFCLLAAAWSVGFIRTIRGAEVRQQENGYRQVSRFSVPVSDRHTLAVYECCLEKMKLHDSPILMTNPAAATPFLAQAYREPVQCLILKEIPADDTELTVYLIHELVHFRRKDLKIRKILSVFGAVYWFVGAQKMFDHQIKQLQESLCDQEAMEIASSMGNKENFRSRLYYDYIIDLAAGEPEVSRQDKPKVTLEERITDVLRNINSMSSATSSGSVSVPTAAVIVLLMTLAIALYYTPAINGTDYWEDMVTVSAKASSLTAASEIKDYSGSEVIIMQDDYSEIPVPAGKSIIVKPAENNGENAIVAVDAYSDSGKFLAGCQKDGRQLFAESDSDGCITMFEDGESLGSEIILENPGDSEITVCLYFLY